MDSPGISNSAAAIIVLAIVILFLSAAMADNTKSGI
jgi:hypothetical protein